MKSLRQAASVLLASLVLSLGLHAQPTPTVSTVSLGVDKTTGAIAGPVTAATFASANALPRLTTGGTFLSGATVTFASGSTLTLSGSFAGTPTGGTLNLAALTLTLPATITGGGTSFVRQDGSYANPAWITSLAGSKLTGAYTAAGLTLSTSRLLGRTTASPGAAEEISVTSASGISLSSGALALAAVPNSSLANSAITIAGTSTALGASITLDAIDNGLAANGLIARTAANTRAARTITGTANEITLTNGDGVSGNPTVSLPSALTFTGKTVTGGTYASPTLTTPSLGVATATSINGLTINTTTGTLAIAAGKTFTASNTLTLAGTDGSTLNVGTGGTLGTAAYTATTAYVPAYAGLTTNGLLQATGATTVASTLTPSGLTSLSAGSHLVAGTAGAGFVDYVYQSSTPTTPAASHVVYYADATGRLTWLKPDGFTRTFDGASNTASRVYTLPDADSKLPVFSQFVTFAGPTAARTVTLPDANFTAARTDAGQTFTGTQAFGAAVVTTLNGHTFTTGSSTFTGTAAQTYTFPTTSATLARTDASQTFTGTQTLAQVTSSIGDGATAFNATSAGSLYGLVVNRSATNKFALLSLRTATSEKWAVGMREVSNDYFRIYSSGSFAGDALVIRDDTAAVTFGSTTSGTSTTAAAILGKSMGLTENLWVAGTGNIGASTVSTATSSGAFIVANVFSVDGTTGDARSSGFFKSKNGTAALPGYTFSSATNAGLYYYDDGSGSGIGFAANGTSAGTVNHLQNWALAGNLNVAGVRIVSTDTLSGAGAVSVTKDTTKLTSTGGAQALTLADGVDGQIKRIIHDVDGGSSVLTPTTKTGFSTVTFTNAGDSVTLEFVTTRGWIVVGSYGVTIAP